MEDRRVAEPLVGVAGDDRTTALGVAAVERPVVGGTGGLVVEQSAERGEAFGGVRGESPGLVGIDLRTAQDIAGRRALLRREREGGEERLREW